MGDFGFAKPAAYHGLFRHYQFYYDRLLSLITDVADLRPSYVLDLACGTGEFTCAIARRFPNSKIVGLDISTAFIEFAKANQPDREIEFFVSPANALPGVAWISNVDTIFIKGAYHLFENALPIEVFTRPQFRNLRCVVIVEKIQRSLESYPVPDSAAEDRKRYVSSEWASKRLNVPAGITNQSVSFGHLVRVPPQDYFEAVKQRQFSYLQSVDDAEMDAWLAGRPSEKHINIFEENVCNIYHL
ncbi:MAG: class I SAM-dependent methyltransferase [Pseudomonadota bacterium]